MKNDSGSAPRCKSQVHDDYASYILFPSWIGFTEIYYILVVDASEFGNGVCPYYEGMVTRE